MKRNASNKDRCRSWLRDRWVLQLALLCALSACQKKGAWLIGSWMLVEDGVPGPCHTFKADKTFDVFLDSACKGATDSLLSGKWQAKDKNKIALKRGQDDLATLAIVANLTKDRFTSSGAILGTMVKVEKQETDKLIQKLQEAGTIKLRALPTDLGCAQLGRATSAVKKLPSEAEPRMLRERDRGLGYHSEKGRGPNVKTVFALNQDQIDWVSFDLDLAQVGDDPTAYLSVLLGQPVGRATTGKGRAAQKIAMWNAYCRKLGSSHNKRVDITLFFTAGKKQAYYYVSEGIVVGIWEEITEAAADPSMQSDEEEDAEQEPEPAVAQPATPHPQPPPAPPAAREQPKARATPEVRASPPTPKTPAKAKREGTHGLAAPGREDEI